jgi:hypothetical protein
MPDTASRSSLPSSAWWCIRWLALAVLLSTMMWRPAWSQDSRPTMEAIAEAFASLTTTESGRQAVSIGSPPGRLMRWERPITWTALGRSASPLGSVTTQLLNGQFLQIMMATRGQARFQYAQPKVMRPIGSTFETEEILINRISPNVHMHFDRTIDEQPIVTTYSSSTTEVVATGNLTILIGERGYLLEAARRLVGEAANPVRAAEFKASRCVELTWAGTDRQGILNALILADDQVSLLEIRTCLLRPLGRALGVRGDIKDRPYSSFSADRTDSAIMWSGFDRGVIGMLFDSGLRSGMTAEEVLPIARRLVPKYFHGQYRQ